MISDYKVGKGDSKGKSELSLARSELEFIAEKRDLAVEFIFCLVLIGKSSFYFIFIDFHPKSFSCIYITW